MCWEILQEMSLVERADDMQGAAGGAWFTTGEDDDRGAALEEEEGETTV